MSSIGIFGAGTWGIALARMLSNSGHEVTVWSALPTEIEELDRTRRQKNLPNMEIPRYGCRRYQRAPSSNDPS